MFTLAYSLFFPLNMKFCFSPPITFRSLKVASVNVRGLKNNSKRLPLFHKLKSTRYEVICLQETHTTLQEESLYTSKWSGSSFWNNHKSNESGSEVLFGETFRPRVNGVFKGMQGQNIVIDIESDENLRLILANIYAPSGGTRQKECKYFFSKLEETLRDLNCENINLGGDFNCVLNDLDKSHAVMYHDQSQLSQTSD